MINQNIKLNEKLEALNLKRGEVQKELDKIKSQINEVKEELATIKRNAKQKEKDESSKRRKDLYIRKREELNITFEDMELFNNYMLSYPLGSWINTKVVENKADCIPDIYLIEVGKFIEDIKKGKNPKPPKKVEDWIRRDWKRK